MNNEKIQKLSEDELEDLSGGKLDRKFLSAALASVSILGANAGVSTKAMNPSSSDSPDFSIVNAIRPDKEYKNKISENEKFLDKYDLTYRKEDELKTFFKNVVINQFNAYKEFYLYAHQKRGDIKILKDEEGQYYTTDSKGNKKKIFDYGKNDERVFNKDFSRTARDIVRYYYYDYRNIYRFWEVRGTYAQELARLTMMYPLEYKNFCKEKNIPFKFFGEFRTSDDTRNIKSVFKNYSPKQRQELLKYAAEYANEIVKKNTEKYKPRIIDKLDEVVGKDGHEGIFIKYQDPFDLKVNTNYIYSGILENALSYEKQAMKLYKEVSGINIKNIKSSDTEAICDLYIKNINLSYYMKASNYYYGLMFDYLSKKPLKHS